MMASRLRLRPDNWVWLQGLAFFLLGCSLLLVPERPFYLVCLMFFSTVGGVGLIRCLLGGRRVTIWDVMLVSISLGYGLGTLNTELNWVHLTNDYWGLTAAKPIYIMRTTAWLMLLAAAMCVGSGADHSMVLNGVSISEQQLSLCLTLVVVTAVAALAQVATGAIGYHQDMTDGGVHVSPLAALTVSAICPAMALGSYLVMRLTGWRRSLMIAALLLLTMIQFYQGRRVLIYTLVLCLMFFFEAYPPRRLLSWRTVLIFAVAAIAIFGASKAFFALRMAMWELGSSRDTVALLKKGTDILLDAKRSGLDDEVSDNQNSRTFIIGYPAELIQALEDHDPIYGEVLKLDAALNVPTIFWPSKYKVISIGFEESLANPHFGLPIIDEANSIVTAGLSDFGLPGFFVYPLVLLTIYGLLLRQSRKFGGLAYLLVAATLLNTLLNVEAATADYFNAVRSMILMGMAIMPVVFVWRAIVAPLQPRSV